VRGEEGGGRVFLERKDNMLLHYVGGGIKNPTRMELGIGGKLSLAKKKKKRGERKREISLSIKRNISS